MLSRVASSIYWMARYIERAENLARFTDVALHVSLDHASTQHWEPLVRATGDEEYFIEKYGEFTSENVRQFLTFDEEYSSSILTCLRTARENARTVREAISSEAWETLNEYFHFLQRAAEKKITFANAELYADVKKFSHLFSGIFDSTMSRDKGWYFANIGRFLERADKTSRILDVKYFTLLPKVDAVGTTVDDLLWSAVLRSVSGFEMFRKRYHTLTIERIIEFLVLNDRFPRAINYCIKTATGSLSRVGGPENPNDNEAFLQANTLLNSFSTQSPRSVIDGGLHEFIDAIQVQMNGLAGAINSTYFAKRNGNSQKQSQTQSSQSQKQSSKAG